MKSKKFDTSLGERIPSKSHYGPVQYWIYHSFMARLGFSSGSEVRNLPAIQEPQET